MRTVTIRIAAAIDHTGDWCAYGSKGETDEDTMATAAQTLSPGENRYFLTATLTVPEVQEVNATVHQQRD